MIFVTVGTQLPFDRLISAVDAWAGRAGRRDVLAQIGPSQLRPTFIQYRSFLSPDEFVRHFAAAELVIAHAGMGSIISAMSHGKAILVMPRSADLKEHRTDHQLATARHFRELGRVQVAMDERELIAQLNQLEAVPKASRVGPYASQELLATIRTYLSGCNVIEPDVAISASVAHKNEAR